jgi:ABC-2 type transport system ATP-binding protein
MAPVLSVKDVFKRFGEQIVANHTSFEVNQGTIFGLLGPNGAGKTTLIRMICNIFSPDSGEVLLFGEKMSPKLQERIGYLPEERGLYKKNKIIDQITYFGELKGMSHSAALISANEWLRKMGATAWKDKKVEELSKGMQQKIQFISTVVHSPDFIILDEPFSGFDPVNTELLKSVILEMKSQGKTIILSTHIMSQVEEMCDAVCMINKGNAVLQGSVSDVRKSYQRSSVHIEYEGQLDFSAIEGVTLVSQTEATATLKINDTNTFNRKAFINNINSQADIYNFSVDTPSMNDIFIDVVSRTSNL